MAATGIVGSSESIAPSFEDLLQQGWLAPLIVGRSAPEDALRFAAASRLCRVVRLEKPVGDWHLERKRTWRNDGSRYTPHEWQPLAIDGQTNVHTVVLKCRWVDQGWGNRKGMLSIVAPGGTAPNDYADWGADVMCGQEPAPHTEEPLTLSFRPPVCSREPNMTYTICARAGGGGGHSLTVSNLRVRILRYLPTLPFAQMS